MRNTFSYNGHSSDEYGVYIEQRHNLSRSARKFQTASVAGRNGNIYRLENAWEEVMVSYDIYAGGKTKGDDESAFTDIFEWLNSADDYAVLSDTYDTGHYRLAVFVDATDVESQWLALGRATITFRCRPERFLVTTPLTPASGGTITNSTNHVAEPIITLTGSGARSMLDLAKSIDTSHNGTYTAISSLIPLMSSKVWIARRNTGASGNPLEVNSSAGSIDSITNTNGVIEFTAGSSYRSQDWGVAVIQSVNGDSDYTLSLDMYNTGQFLAICVDKSGNNNLLQAFRYSYQGSSGWQSFSMPFHTPSECGYIVCLFARLGSFSDATLKFRKIMLNQGTTALPFLEYSASTPSSLTINGTTISFNGAFASGEVDCERENITIDGADSNSGASVTDQYGNLSVDYLQFKTGNNSISWTGEITAVSIDPRFWEL